MLQNGNFKSNFLASFFFFFLLVSLPFALTRWHRGHAEVEITSRPPGIVKASLFIPSVYSMCLMSWGYTDPRSTDNNMIGSSWDRT